MKRTRWNLRISGRGFTLIELLVAMAVLALLVVMLLGIVDSGAALWRSNENRVDAYREARAAVNIMSRDLRAAFSAKNTNYFLLNDSGAFGRVNGAEEDENRASVVMFLATLPPSAQDPSANKSEVCEVGYFLAYGKSSAVSGAQMSSAGLGNSLNLYRYFRSSDQTFTNIATGPSALFNNISPTGTETDLLARNIKSFRLTAYGTNNAGELVPFVSSPAQALPALVELSITALNQDTAKKLNSLTDWTATPAGLTNTVRQAEQTFTVRIRPVEKSIQ